MKTHADLIRKELAALPEDKRNQAIILFSAHSLPLKVKSLLLNRSLGLNERCRQSIAEIVIPPKWGQQ